jgi:hypothetical protein
MATKTEITIKAGLTGAVIEDVKNPRAEITFGTRFIEYNTDHFVSYPKKSVKVLGDYDRAALKKYFQAFIKNTPAPGYAGSIDYVMTYVFVFPK